MSKFEDSKMDLLDSRNQRRTRFQKTQSEGQNLYMKIYEMLIKKKYAKAEESIAEHFLRDPFSGEAMLSWEAWDNLTSLFSRFCFDWIQIRSRDGARPFGPWSTN